MNLFLFKNKNKNILQHLDRALQENTSLFFPSVLLVKFDISCLRVKFLFFVLFCFIFVFVGEYVNRRFIPRTKSYCTYILFFDKQEYSFQVFDLFVCLDPLKQIV